MNTAFKEWALVCEALGCGETSVILRKGGIHEGRDGFRFEHSEFFLFPTQFHSQTDRLKVPSDTPLPPHVEGEITIRYMARVEWTKLVTDETTALALDAFHPWKKEVVLERFHYDTPAGVHIAFVRVYRLETPWTFPDASQYGGCRSWVTLPEPPSLKLIPVLDDATHRSLEVDLNALLQRTIPPCTVGL